MNIKPIADCNANVSNSTGDKPAGVKPAHSPLTSVLSNITGKKNKLYTDKEVSEIVKKFPCLPHMTGASNEYIVEFVGNSLVINNQFCTNQTVEIKPDGSAISVGSWHHKNIAGPGTYSDLLADAKQHYDKKHIDFKG